MPCIILKYNSSLFISETAKCFDKGIDYNGDDIEGGVHRNIKTLSDCQQLCKNTEECQYFSYMSKGLYPQTCFMKHGKGTPTAYTNIVSGPKQCPSKYIRSGLLF